MRHAIARAISLSAAMLLAHGAHAQYVPNQSSLDRVLSANIGRQNVHPTSDAEIRLGISRRMLTAADDLAVTATARTIGALKPDRGLSRDLHDSQIYKIAAPAVVLVVTKEGLGSGSLIGSDGTILTNAHVVQGYTRVAVVFKPQQEGSEPTKSDAVLADVIKVDTIKDLALLRVSSTPRQISPIKFGAMDSVSVGQDVHAIGHPTGEAWSYTKGIVSQVRPNYVWSAENEPHTATVIQTQTPINPGNSGGPLLDDSATLIGVNSFKAADTENVNFAISVEDVQSFLREAPRPVAPGPSASCEPKVLYRGESDDKSELDTLVDLDCTGKPSAVLILPADVSQPLMFALFRGDVSNIYRIYFDPSRSAKWQTSIWRDDTSGPWLLLCAHDKGDIVPTRCERYETAIAKK